MIGCRDDTGTIQGNFRGRGRSAGQLNDLGPSARGDRLGLYMHIKLSGMTRLVVDIRQPSSANMRSWSWAFKVWWGGRGLLDLHFWILLPLSWGDLRSNGLCQRSYCHGRGHAPRLQYPIDYESYPDILDRLLIHTMAVIDSLKNAVGGSNGPVFDKNDITVIFVLGGPGVGRCQVYPVPMTL